MKALILAVATVLFGMTLIATDAGAARLGGGRSLGMQRNYAAPPARAPIRQAAPTPRQQPPAAAPAPASGSSRWMPMLGGLALGGILGSMFGGGGLGSGFGGLLLMALLALGAVLLLRMLIRMRAPETPGKSSAGDAN